MIMDRLGQRMTDFVGSTGAKVVRAVEEVVPGLQPPRRRRLTIGRVALAAGAAVVAGVGSAVARRDGLGGAVSKVEEVASTAKQRVVDLTSTDGNGTAAGSGLADASELASKSWAELMQLAKESGLKGRSGMKKDQLVKALSSTSNGR